MIVRSDGSTEVISTHDLTRRSTWAEYLVKTGLIFQLTTSRGGRRVNGKGIIHEHNISTHDLTRRSTRVVMKLLIISMYFNSRPHEEVDRIQIRIATL